MHLVGFIIRIYRDVQSRERKIKCQVLNTILKSMLKCKRFIKLFVLICMLICCVYGVTIYAIMQL